jgi:hypothetical protein
VEGPPCLRYSGWDAWKYTRSFNWSNWRKIEISPTMPFISIVGFSLDYLGHPVNDLFDLRTDGRPHENDLESAKVKPSDPVEKASREGIECRHGGFGT